MKNILPINGLVLIRPADKDSYKTADGSSAGIFVKTESKWNNYSEGMIIFVSPKYIQDGKEFTTPLEVGDQILYARAITVPARDEISFNGETLIVKKVTDVLGRIMGE